MTLPRLLPRTLPRPQPPRRHPGFSLGWATSLLLLSACQETPPPAFAGYGEGEFLYLAAPASGYLADLTRPRGSHVQAGERLAALAADPDNAALSEAEAKQASAREKLANLQAARRPSEVAGLEANLRAAEAALRLANAQLAREEALFARHFVARARVDEAIASRDGAAAQVDSAREQLTTYRDSLGRRSEVQGAAADLAAAAAQSDQKRWQLQQKTLQAPTPGEITDTYYRPGEWVMAGQPVLALLPDDRRRIRFFVAQADLGQLRLGQGVEARCDGCGAPLLGQVDFIAPQPEYTPPVIYSQGSREKLVYRVEAVPRPADARRLHPGQALDVRLTPAEPTEKP